MRVLGNCCAGKGPPPKDIPVPNGMFWGCAEPIAITVLRRKEDADVGTVRNILLRNILCDSENGIVIYGQEQGMICGITLDHICLNLRRVTDYSKGFHDLRPTTGPAFTETGLHFALLHNAQQVRFSNCCFRADESLAPLIQTPYFVQDCSDVQL